LYFLTFIPVRLTRLPWRGTGGQAERQKAIAESK